MIIFSCVSSLIYPYCNHHFHRLVGIELISILVYQVHSYIFHTVIPMLDNILREF